MNESFEDKEPTTQNWIKYGRNSRGIDDYWGDSYPINKYKERKKLPVDINAVEIELGISFGMDTGMDQGDELEENKTKMRIFDLWN